MNALADELKRQLKQHRHIFVTDEGARELPDSFDELLASDWQDVCGVGEVVRTEYDLMRCGTHVFIIGERERAQAVAAIREALEGVL